MLIFRQAHTTTMTMLTQEYGDGQRARALDMLLIDRHNEFRTLGEAIFWSTPDAGAHVERREEFILNFCLEVSAAFRTWSGEAALAPNSDTKALTFLRQLAHGKKTMTELCHLLNLAYTLAEEFKVVYRRIG